MTDELMRKLTFPEGLRDLLIITNIVSAILVFYISRSVTNGAGFYCPIALYRMLHRIALGLVSIALMYEASLLITSGEAPTVVNLLVNGAWMFALIVGAVRHSAAPPIPSWHTWKNHSSTLHY